MKSIDVVMAILKDGLAETGYESRNTAPYQLDVFKRSGLYLGYIRLINRSKLTFKVQSRFLGIQEEISLFDPNSIERTLGILDPFYSPP